MAGTTGHIFSLLFSAGFVIIIAFLMIILVIVMKRKGKIKVRFVSRPFGRLVSSVGATHSLVSSYRLSKESYFLGRLPYKVICTPYLERNVRAAPGEVLEGGGPAELP